jgi:hypothetical protein
MIIVIIMNVAISTAALTEFRIDESQRYLEKKQQNYISLVKHYDDRNWVVNGRKS